MQQKRPLNRYLPIRFANGEQIRQFSKPCVRCGHMLNAKDMMGVARLLDDSLAIAAKAQCPKCGETFGVACRIDNHKRVTRVVMPEFLFSWFLRNLPVQAREREAEQARANEAKTETTDTIPAPAAPTPREVIRADESVGSYQGKVIPAWVKVDGRQLAFDRIALNARPGPGEFLLDECLVYRG
ncbi:MULTISPECIES: hypothetical protein [Silvimonas]|uniref:hypothetical protein n=1 Tax=Silvimonas TaxID=300264 RepID=UPI0024B3ADDD|nr:MULTISPECIES: hypothetical protein [Silvimonas]MDR3426750.1 hypothetical protein [Silvimonas sp.]